MRLESIPIVFGVVFALVAALLMFDAATPDNPRPHRERRRRHRAEIDSAGEWMIAIGSACLAGALFGGEEWRWTTIAMLSAAVLIVFGAILNRAYLSETFLNRGVARRTQEHEVPPDASKSETPAEKLRIR